MASNVVGRARATAAAAGFDRGAASTRSLLGYGVIVGPFYLVVGLMQAFVRDGFDLARHPLSVLAVGEGGWVQTTNFVLSGAMVIAAAVGIIRALRPQSGLGGWFLGAFGVSMLAAAVFEADAVDGFPIGTPLGPPTTMSQTGMIHFAAGAIGFLSLAVSCLVVARALSKRKASAIARLSVVSGIAVIAGFFAPAVFSSLSAATAGIWFSVVVGWAWLAITSVHLYRTSPDPSDAPRAT